MEEDNKKIQEPFNPEKAPGSPKGIDPENEKKKRAPGSDEEKPGGPANSQQKENPHLLNEETEINDETTI